MDVTEPKRIYWEQMWEIATQLLTHHEQTVRELAIISIGLMREMLPKDWIEKLEGK